MMHRTQVLLGDEEMAALDAAQRSSGASRGELIRRAVRAAYTRSSAPERPSPRGRFAHLDGGVWSEELVAERRAEAAREG